ncbi:MAG: vitamin K epoxide reductase family protein [Candidatus Marinimicrobia bacterium]|nr:vitamin K epoxide reductase family protein [Candidatus Neomarinimicrobiota bacterium]MCF7828816.1 vitamin K epoxide reductase family protein [Candidatus Neomarinimicrobiota bacterium]
MQGAIILLAIVGALIALYFSLATYQIVREDLIESMPVCNVHGERERIVDTFYGRVFFLPNSIYGFVYYMTLLVTAIFYWQQITGFWAMAYLIGSGFVAVFSLFLFWSLQVKLNTMCRLCVTSHVINLIIFGIFGVRYV